VLAAIWLLLLATFSRRLLVDWREPVLAFPVLIVESDDWGPGPIEDAQRLEELAELLQGFRDSVGRPPLVTLGVILAAPGGQRPGVDGARYVPQTLETPTLAPIRRAMIVGRDAGVFALQLHGMEHFWPPALEKAAQHDPAAAAFLNPGGSVPRHESLPPHLQARWIDASRLPSRPVDDGDVERAVRAETACFARTFGMPATVAVPVTFTWTSSVEAAWARHGIRVVVTPGVRNTGRDEHGRMVSDGSQLRNGDHGAGGIVFLVRDIYFEPALGHTADRALLDIREHHRLGRPALLETHRFNFTGADAKAVLSFAELERLLKLALATIPNLRFMSTEALAEAYRLREPELIDVRLAARLRALVLRAAAEPRLRKLAWVSGLALAGWVVLLLASARLPRSSGALRIN
jgi:hypothetical protein